MLASQELKELIMPFVTDSDVFTNDFPSDFEVDVGKMTVVVSDYDVIPQTFGNDIFSEVELNGKVQVFFPITTEKDPTNFLLTLVSVVNKSGWRLNSNLIHYTDPDTHQAIRVFYCKKIFNIGGNKKWQ